MPFILVYLKLNLKRVRLIKKIKKLKAVRYKKDSKILEILEISEPSIVLKDSIIYFAGIKFDINLKVEPIFETGKKALPKKVTNRTLI